MAAIKFWITSETWDELKLALTRHGAGLRFNFFRPECRLTGVLTSYCFGGKGNILSILLCLDNQWIKLCYEPSPDSQ